MSAHKEHFTWKHYAINGTVLTFLMSLTIWASTIEMGMLNLPVALAIALTKVVFILMIFMNVWKSSQLTKVFAGAGFFWLMILLAFVFADLLLPELGSPGTTPIP